MKNKKLYIIFSILIVLFAISIVNKTFQNDTFFTIPIGRNILENGITREEQLVWHDGLTFSNVRWLFDVTIALIYNTFNTAGIYFFVLLITSIIGLTLFNILIKQENNIIVSFIFTLFALYFARTTFTARAQIMSYLLLLIEVFLIDKLQRKQEKKYIILLLIDSILIANFHASVWPMFLILFLPYLVEAVCIKLKISTFSNKIYIEKEKIKLLNITFIIGIFTGLCTPNGFEPYTYMIKNLSGLSPIFINELQPMVIAQNIEMIIFLGICAIILFSDKSKIRLADFLMTFGLLTMAMMAYRNTTFFYLIGTVYVTKWITCIFNNANNSETINEVTEKLSKSNKSVIVLIIPVILFSIYNYTGKINQNYINKTLYPVEAVNYILENIDIENMKIYNGFNFGSYLEFKAIPAFMDSRSEMYCKEFNDTNILNDYYQMSIGKVSYNEIFEKYGITHALLYKDEVINTYLKMDNEYKLLYEDDNFVFYEKKK